MRTKHSANEGKQAGRTCPAPSAAGHSIGEGADGAHEGQESGGAMQEKKAEPKCKKCGACLIGNEKLGERCNACLTRAVTKTLKTAGL